MFVFNRERKKYVWIKLIPGVMVYLGIAFLMSCISIALPDQPLLGALPFLIIFIFSIVLLKICFVLPFKYLVLCGVAAYSFQNMLFRMVTIVESLGMVHDLFLLMNDYFWAFNLVYIIIFIPTSIIVYFFIIKRINEFGIENIYSKNVLLISVITLFVTLILCSYTNAYWWQSKELSMVIYCFAVLSGVYVLVIISGMFENSNLRNEISKIKDLWKQDKQHYEIAKDNIELINIKCHDLRHKIRELRLSEGNISENELLEIENSITIYDNTINTGCSPIDVMLTEKSLICYKKRIQLTRMIEGEALNFISDSDLYSLFGNMLTNAINAVGKIKEIENRIITLTVSKTAGMILINCINYFTGELEYCGDFPKTESGNTAEHGFGMKSMYLIVEKYGGEMFFTAENGIFDLKIMIPEKIINLN